MPQDHLFAAADPALQPFLEETDEAASEALLADLMSQHAQPIIHRVIRRKLGVSLSAADGSARNQDALELAGDVNARLVAELQGLKLGPIERAIGDFAAYVAVATYNGCHDYLRCLHPRRWQLRNKLRYLLTHRPQLALWQGPDGDWLCGLSTWGRAAPDDDFGSDASPRSPRDFLESQEAAEASARAQPDRQVEAMLRWIGAPIRVDRLVELAAEVWRVEDAPTAAEPPPDLQAIADPAPDASTHLSERSYLERVWTEIGTLPARQRSALLLGLRDSRGAGMVGLLPVAGVASIRQIASALETPAEQFAEQWKTLPWDDTRIGRHLGIERQQVVNLRKAARARLARRMRGC